MVCWAVGARLVSLRVVLSAVLFSCVFEAEAQTHDTEFSPAEPVWMSEEPEWESDEPWLERAELFERRVEPEFAPQSDRGVFVTPAWSQSGPFEEFARYRFGDVRYRQRGLDDRRYRVVLAGADLMDDITQYPDYSLITLLRRAGLSVTRPAAVVGGVESYSLQAAGEGLYVLTRAGDRYSRGGGDLRHSGAGGRGWSWTVGATGEAGDDGHIKGVFTNALGGVASLSKEWASGARLTFFGAGGVSERGARTAATEEAFALIGNKLYNPVWGLQEGRVRNSRVNGVRQFFGAVEFSVPLGSFAAAEGVAGGIGRERMLYVSVAYRRARGGRSRLAWMDTHSPMPDYYRSMPSFFPPGAAEELVEAAWRSGDERITQVNWHNLYYNNTLAADGRATYLVEEQVEQANDVHLAATVNAQIDSELSLAYGVRVGVESSRFFKEAADLLGAQWLPNIDQYADDPTDGEYHAEPPNENDLRNPGRQVAVGKRFGYDYAFTRLRPSVFGSLHWNRATYGLVAEASLTYARMQREGFYEKELFPGDAAEGLGGSFGRSPAVEFTTFSASLSAYWSPSVRHSLSVSALAATEAPRMADMFLSPEQNSLMVSDLTPSGLFGAEAAWVWTGEGARLRAAAFVNAQTSETQVYRYYDDLAGAFSDMVVRGVNRLAMGVELGAEVRLARPLTLAMGASVGDFRYNSEPRATIFDDATGRLISDDIVCYVSGLRTGPPQTVLGTKLEYYDRKYWRITLYGEWLGRRHVEINPLYHSSRIVGINAAPEVMALFTGQERLPDAFTLGASVSKGWVLRRGYLRIVGSARNLLSTSIIHSGYEQMRIRRLGSGSERTLVPFPSKYLWSYPMTWNVTVSYRL